MSHSEEVLIRVLQGCHPLSRIFSSTRKWLSRRVDWIVSADFMNSSFWFVTLVFRETSDNPNPALKRLTILFLTLEGKGLLVPCIRRQKFKRFVKAPKWFSCHLELGNLNLCSDHVKKPVYPGLENNKNITRDIPKNWANLIRYKN